MNSDNRTFAFMALLAGLLAITALPEAGGQSPPPQAQAVGQQDEEETEEEKEKKKNIDLDGAIRSGLQGIGSRCQECTV